MKKIFSFFTAALMSASMFAALTPAPDDATLNAYKGKGDNLVVAIYVDDSIKCNDIVWLGTYYSDGKDWKTDVDSLVRFQAVEGYAGWYVACIADPSESIEGKPVQLDGAGKFNWDYQVGQLDQTAVVSGVATISAGYSNECNIKEIGDSKPLLLNVTKWKTNPCTAKFHDYKITVISPDCNETDFVVPAISGGFNSWAQDSMAIDDEATNARMKDELPGAVFTYTARAAEGTQYKFRSAESWGKDWTNELKEYDETAGEWKNFNDGNNFTFDASTEIVYDLGDPTKYTWTNCERPMDCDSMDYTITAVLPACEAAAPNVIGSFCGWSGGVAMTLVEGNTYTATVRALCTDQFKFNDAVLGWDNEIQVKDGEGWKGTDNINFGTEAAISVDYSSEDYRWIACAPKEITETFFADLNAAKPLSDLLVSSLSVNEGVLSMEVSSTAWDPSGIVIPFDGYVKGSKLAAIKGSFKCAAISIYTEIYPYVIDSKGNRWYEKLFEAASCTDWTAFEHSNFKTMYDEQDAADFVNRDIVAFGFVASSGTPLDKYAMDLKEVEIVVNAETALAEIAAKANVAKKVMMNGQMYIVVNGAIYNVMGAVVK